MKLGVRWGLKGIRPEAREAAKEAARRAGMSVEDWLSSAIAHTASQMGVPQPGPQIPAGPEAYAQANQQVLQRRVQQVMRRGPEAYAPPHMRQAAQAAAPLPHLPHAPSLTPAKTPPAPPVHWASDIDHAVAEITARRRALGGAPARQTSPMSAPMQAPGAAPRPHIPAQDLSGLEEQLRNITTQIETLRKPGVEDAINALRNELSGIGRAMTEAMPRRAIETIEAEIQNLSARVAEGKQAGANGEALAGIEHGLMEVREALHTLTPAESLVGFNDAINTLAHKIDVIVAQQDPATLQQLEHAVHTLRDVSGHIASNEMVGQLAQHVEQLADKVDKIANAAAAGDALTSLEHRIGALADALAERSENGGQVPPRLEALVGSLSDKIEKIQSTRGDTITQNHLEDRIVQLVERLDASDSRLGHLEAIERGLADLLVHIEELRVQKASGGPAAPSPAVDELRDDIGRTRLALDAVHGTLGHVVDRLAAIEQEIRRESRADAHGHQPDILQLQESAMLNTPVGKLAVRAVPADAPMAPPAQHAYTQGPSQTPVQAPVQTQAPAAPRAQQQDFSRPFAPTAQPSAEQSQVKRPPPLQTKRKPINPDLPPDVPLEPGTRQAAVSIDPAARIAASEADLGDARPKDEAPAGGKSFILAAARRAAKLAMRDKSPRVTKPKKQPEFIDEAAESPRASLATKLKKLFVAASVIAIVIGLVQITATFLDNGRHAEPDSKPADASDAGAPPKQSSVSPDKAIAKPKTVAQVPALSAPSTVPAIPSIALSSAQDMLGRGFGASRDNAPRAEVTGSIGTQDNVPVTGEKLPIVIGGAALRNAALAGDPTAAYEVATRYIEGRGTPANTEDAVRWFERAAAKGIVPAQFRLATLFEKGLGVKKDLGRARKLYLSAAEQGNAKAMHNLAVLYAEGIAGRPDYKAAAHWFQKAADHGISDSQYNLGVLYARGLGIEKNLGESYKWFARAAAQGDREALKKRDDVQGQLDAKTVAQSQKSLKSWSPQRQPDAAIIVPAPAEGWDQAAPEPAPAKSRSKAAGTIDVGRR